MARRHLQSEVVTADSADRAVAALAGRVPDVLLTSPLLSPRDEVTVAAWLRDLGPAAAHVQELTIPILAAAATPAPKRRGMLSALRGGGRRSATADGCDLDVFARQIATYMKLAPPALMVSEPRPDIEAPEIAAATAPVVVAAVAPEIPVAPELTAAAVEPEVLVAFAPEIVAAAVEPEMFVAVAPEMMAAAARKTPAPAARRKRPQVVEPELEIVPVAAPPIRSVDVDDEESWVPVSFDDVCDQPLSTPEEAPEKVWDLGAPAPSLPRPEPKKKGRRPAGKKPMQDEWGLFDPEQCGFAALIVKLDEVTDTNNAEPKGADTTVRLLAH